jgi:hypothetical protein
MNRNTWVRKIHRWMSIAFTATVIVSFLALTLEEPPIWLFYLPLPPLALQLFTGLYLFVLPYVSRSRSQPRTASAR